MGLKLSLATEEPCVCIRAMINELIVLSFGQNVVGGGGWRYGWD